jgi:hypothetical protein
MSNVVEARAGAVKRAQPNGYPQSCPPVLRITKQMRGGDVKSSVQADLKRKKRLIINGFSHLDGLLKRFG